MLYYAGSNQSLWPSCTELLRRSQLKCVVSCMHPTHARSRTHARTHARFHARTHTHTTFVVSRMQPTKGVSVIDNPEFMVFDHRYRDPLHPFCQRRVQASLSPPLLPFSSLSLSLFLSPSLPLSLSRARSLSLSTHTHIRTNICIHPLCQRRVLARLYPHIPICIIRIGACARVSVCVCIGGEGGGWVDGWVGGCDRGLL